MLPQPNSTLLECEDILVSLKEY